MIEDVANKKKDVIAIILSPAVPNRRPDALTAKHSSASSPEDDARLCTSTLARLCVPTLAVGTPGFNSDAGKTSTVSPNPNLRSGICALPRGSGQFFPCRPPRPSKRLCRGKSTKPMCPH